MLPKQHLGRTESFKEAGNFVPGWGGGGSCVNVPEEWSWGPSTPGGESEGEQAETLAAFLADYGGANTLLSHSTF